MMNYLFLAGNDLSKETGSIGNGALYSLLAILMVFAILLIIIGITTLIFRITGLFDMKAELDAAKNKNAAPKEEAKEETPSHVEIKDDDMMAAVLVATIDYQSEIKKDVKVVYVKEI